MSRSTTALLAALILCPAGAGAQVGGGLAGPAVSTGPSVQGFLFGDVRYEGVEGQDPGFRLGQIVGHANATLSNHLVFFGEVSLSYRGPSYAVTMERAILRYEFNDALKVSAGRYHTPISYWNTAYHHGLWLQGSVDRPRAVTFGTPFIPVHFVGAMAEGTIPGTPVHYMGGVGNGRSENGVGAQDGGDANDGRAVIASASIQPAQLLGVRLGGAVYLDRVPSTSSSETDERILSAHAVWERDMVEIIAEYIDVWHEPTAGGTARSSSAYYAHLGLRLSGAWDAVTPYIRWESMDIDLADPVFGGVLPDYNAWIGGIRYDFEGLAALKAEYRNEEIAGAATVDSLIMQASFAIPIGGQS